MALVSATSEETITNVTPETGFEELRFQDRLERMEIQCVSERLLLVAN